MRNLTAVLDREQIGYLVRRFLPIAGVLVYQGLTLWNIYFYLTALARRTSGEHYFAYEIAQSWLNFWLRIPLAMFPIFESSFLDLMIAPGSSLHPGIFIYSFWEIAVVDLTCGAAVWWLVLALAGRALRRMFRW